MEVDFIIGVTSHLDGLGLVGDGLNKNNAKGSHQQKKLQAGAELSQAQASQSQLRLI